MITEYMRDRLHRMRDLDTPPVSTDPETRVSAKINGRTCVLTLTGSKAVFHSHGWMHGVDYVSPPAKYVGELATPRDTVQDVNSVVQSGKGYDRLKLAVFESFGNEIPNGRIGGILVGEVEHVFGGPAFADFVEARLKTHEGVVVRDSMGNLSRYKPQKTIDLLIVGATPDFTSLLAAGCANPLRKAGDPAWAVVSHVPILKPIDIPSPLLSQLAHHVDSRGVRYRFFEQPHAAEIAYLSWTDDIAPELGLSMDEGNTYEGQVREYVPAIACRVGRLISPSFVRWRPDKDDNHFKFGLRLSIPQQHVVTELCDLGNTEDQGNDDIPSPFVINRVGLDWFVIRNESDHRKRDIWKCPSRQDAITFCHLLKRDMDK